LLPPLDAGGGVAGFAGVVDPAAGAGVEPPLPEAGGITGGAACDGSAGAFGAVCAGPETPLIT